MLVRIEKETAAFAGDFIHDMDLIIPIFTINACLFVSVNYHLLDNTIFEVDLIGQSGFTIPYIDGS